MTIDSAIGGPAMLIIFEITVAEEFRISVRSIPYGNDIFNGFLEFARNDTEGVTLVQLTSMRGRGIVSSFGSGGGRGGRGQGGCVWA